VPVYVEESEGKGTSHVTTSITSSSHIGSDGGHGVSSSYGGHGGHDGAITYSSSSHH